MLSETTSLFTFQPYYDNSFQSSLFWSDFDLIYPDPVYHKYKSFLPHSIFNSCLPDNYWGQGGWDQWTMELFSQDAKNCPITFP